MRTLKINSETWLWQRGRFNVVIRQEGTNTKYVVPFDKIGRLVPCPYCLELDCFDSKVEITPRHIRTYIDLQRKST